MKKKASSQASWSILSEGVSASRVEAHILRTHINQMIKAIKEDPKISEEVFKRCGDNFEAIPKHLAKMERALDRTNYALISMGSDWYRQRLTHEDREMVDMAAKYNPTPYPSISKQSDTKRKAGIGRIISNIIDKYENELERLDPEYINSGESWIAETKRESLYQGDIETAMTLTRSRRVKEVLMQIESEIERAVRGASQSVEKSASEVIRNLEMRVAILEKRSNPTKIASQNRLARKFNEEQIISDLERIDGINNVSLDDEMGEDVISFLIDKSENKSVEKEIRQVAKKHGVKFDKGEFADSLGMISIS